MDQTVIQDEMAGAIRENADAGAHPFALPPKRIRIDWPVAMSCLAAAALYAAVSWPLLRAWVLAYISPDGYYAYAPIIPFIVALMLWHRRDALRSAEVRPSPWALLVILPALPLLIFTTRYFASSLSDIAFFAILWGSVWAICGARFLRAAAFPLGFLITMAPIPRMLLTDSTQGLQMLSTAMATKFLHLCFLPAVMDGNIIHMQNYSLFVDVPCSGFKLLLSLLTTNAALAYLLDGSPAKRFLLFLISMPLSLVINAVRIGLIGIVGDCIGPDAAHVFHDWSGMLTLVLGVAALLLAAKGFGCRTFAGWPLF